ncbi:granzyme B-like [Polypterus senegalus]|uniref:granzyme B-like n=1 Tax=Polypterus senegalus TaxID=55291 RepID=UPI0019652C8A|nr:granzyme B-like [Polypterus senegalus]XP_039614111.1 granzyme B-like [Polypterus senegalus]
MTLAWQTRHGGSMCTRSGGLRMWTLFLQLLALILITQAHAGSSSARIINGKEVKPHSRPYMASLQVNGQHHCGGFLVDKYFVMTAAHCRDRDEPLTVVLGAHSLKESRKLSPFFVECYHIHPKYSKTTKSNDIMLLKLMKPALPLPHVEPIKLPKANRVVKPESECEVCGWGVTSGNHKQSDKLQAANVTVMDEKYCRKDWPVQAPTSLCTRGRKGDGGFCEGDSGGPLVCGQEAVGIVSLRGGPACDKPTVSNLYVKIVTYLKWIKEVMKRSKTTAE